MQVMVTASELEHLLADLALPAAHRALLMERFRTSVSLVDAGEVGVALENLCDNLYEFDVVLPQSVSDQLVAWGQSVGVGADRLEVLGELAVSSGSGSDA